MNNFPIMSVYKVTILINFVFLFFFLMLIYLYNTFSKWQFSSMFVDWGNGREYIVFKALRVNSIKTLGYVENPDSNKIKKILYEK